jgi:hypothetical protein
MVAWTEEGRNAQKKQVKSNHSDKEDRKSSLFQASYSWKERQARDRAAMKETKLSRRRQYNIHKQRIGHREW